MKNLRLDRPLIVFDLETTGVDPARDKIVEIATLKLLPDGTRDPRRRLVNPGRPIPPGATKVHGIQDEDVREAPEFQQIARSLLDYLGDSDLAGFNVARFDIPLLEREFNDCQLDLGMERRRVIDAMAIYHRKERRDLTAAVEFFLGRDHDGAHTAEADVNATADVLEAQLERYGDLPRDVAELERWIRRIPANAVDAAGKLVRKDDCICINFGKYRGLPLDEVARDNGDYLEWLLDTDFPDDAREHLRVALKRHAEGQST